MKILSIPLLFAFGCASAVQPQTFTVTRVDDPAPNGCKPTDCSLREAAIAADTDNSSGPPDLIVLGAGTYALGLGALPLHENLIVQGAGSLLTHVTTNAVLFDGHDLSLDLRGLSLQSSEYFVLTIGNNGTLLLDDVATPADGGRVEVLDNASDLYIRNSDLRAGVQCSQGLGSCSIVDSQLSSVYARGRPAVLVSRSVIDGSLNSAEFFTGVVVDSALNVEIDDSTIIHTKAGLAYLQTDLRLLRVNYVDNANPVYEYNRFDIEIIDSVFDSNTDRAIYAYGDSTWTIRGSSFVNNQISQADDGNANVGGAIFVAGSASLHVENSTFSGNTFSLAAAQDGGRGAAIGYGFGTGANLDLQHVTIVSPIVPFGIQGSGVGGYGGVGEVVVNVSNSILAGSCHFDAGALHHADGNIESTGHTCGFNSSNNQVNVSTANLALGGLGNHGGPTPTYEPSSASFAVDTANPDQCLTLDQRGYQRPAGAGCDVGSIEVGAVDSLFADDFE